MKVGIIGVGLMGHGIARNVLRKGKFELGFLDHPGNQPVDEITGLGAVAYDTPAALAAVSDVIILCVTGSPQVEAIVTGDNGLVSALKPGAVVVDCSTALPDSTLRMGDAVQAALGRLREGARGSENLMPAILEAVRAYATLGEMCGVLREEWGEYTPVTVV